MLTTYEIGDKVRLRATGRVGTVKSYKYERSRNSATGAIEEQSKYFICFNSFTFAWHDEYELKVYHEYEFDNLFELSLLNLLIDVYLKSGDFELVTKLNGQRSKYRR
jgi:hypothetical protein